MKVPRGMTIQELIDSVSHLRPEDKATPREREKARESLKRRCPYLFDKKSVKS